MDKTEPNNSLGENKRIILQSYEKAKKHLFLLDYDGTLAPIVSNPYPRPSPRLISVIKKLTEPPNDRIVIVSGRNKETLQNWFQDIPVDFSADFGAWALNGDGCKLLQNFDIKWKRKIGPIVEKYARMLPNSHTEEKVCAIVLDYRMSEPGMRNVAIKELIQELKIYTQNMIWLETLVGENLFIIRNIGSDKGSAATYWMKKYDHDFVLAIGDDDADEDLFRAVQPHGFTIKIGQGKSSARYFLSDYFHVLELLEECGQMITSSRLSK